jgi:hypothetical protein
MALQACPDCNHQCSTNAEACPGCGNFFQDLRPMKTVQVERTGWATTIGNGVILAWVVAAAVMGFLAFLLLGSFMSSLPINR